MFTFGFEKVATYVTPEKYRKDKELEAALSELRAKHPTASRSALMLELILQKSKSKNGLAAANGPKLQGNGKSLSAEKG